MPPGRAWSRRRGTSAFRQELALAAGLVPAVPVLRVPPASAALLIGAVGLVLVVELLNTAIEAVVDRVSPDGHPPAKRARDAANAAVFVRLVLAGGVRGLLVFALFRDA